MKALENVQRLATKLLKPVKNVFTNISLQEDCGSISIQETLPAPINKRLKKQKSNKRLQSWLNAPRH